MTRFYLLLAAVCHSVPTLRRPFWRYVYQRLARRYAVPDWTFMNYGYVPNDGENDLALDEADVPNRSLIALYHRVASAVDLAGKNVLEVGSGRGGGAAYVARYLEPSRMTGVDISANAVAFCRERHVVAGLTFETGDAEHLPFDDATFDAVLNVESSHCYGSIDTFFSEAHRVLIPGGAFLYADFRPSDEAAGITSALRGVGFEIEEEENITANVLAALDRDSGTKERWIEELAEPGLQDALKTFAATAGTKIYEGFREGELTYFRFLARRA